MKKYFLFIFLLSVSCSSPQAIFASLQNNRVGRPYESISPYESIVSRKLRADGIEVIKIKEGKCFYEVRLDQNKNIVGWSYISKPEDCCVNIDWSAPW
jgi:hypothetical protein